MSDKLKRGKARILTAQQKRAIASHYSLTYLHLLPEDFEVGPAKEYFKWVQEKNYNLMMKRYKNNFINSIGNIPEGNKDILELITPNGQDKFITAINEQVITKLDNTIQDVYNNSDIETLATHARNQYKAGINKGSITSLNALFSDLKLLVEKLNGSTDGALYIILNTKVNKNSAVLKKLIKVANKDGSGVISDSDVRIAKALINLINKINKEGVSSKSMTSSITHLFSTVGGETVIADALKNATQGVNSMVVKMLGDKTPTGTTNLKNAKYKADVSMEGFSFSIEEIDNHKFTMDLNLSVKTYTGKDNSGVSIVTDKPLKQLLSNSFSGIGKYYYSNALIHGYGYGYDEMKQALVMSYADNLLAGTGIKNDTVQFLVINGKLYSVYEILKKLNNDNTQKIIELHIPGEKGIIESHNKLKKKKNKKSSLQMALSRSKKYINRINELKAVGKLNMSLTK